MEQRKLIFLFAFLFIFSLSDATVTPQDNTWHFLFAPYGWLSSLDGDVTVKSNTVDIHIPFRKILKYLDFAGQAHIEMSRNRWTFMIDPTYLKLSKGIQTNLIDANFISKTTLVDTGVFYQLFKPSSQPASLEILGGARYLGLSNELKFNRISNALIARNNLFTPIVGARIKYDPSQKAHLWLRGDYGGFNVDDVERTWSSTAGFSYTVHRHIDLGIAYRVLGIKFTQKDNPINIVMYGPMIGIAFYS